VPYLLFCTEEVNPPEKMPDRHRVVSVDSELMGAAISAACKLITDGVIVWQVRGPDGFMMERSDIESECLRRQGRSN
jgi:hypothetical protein